LTGKIQKLDIDMCFVDVDDVAHAHLQAVKVPEARNNRFLTSCGGNFGAINDILKEKYPDMKVTLSSPPGFML
jgi:nucleoside-diphosphate-sugar epimerase